MTKSGFVDLLIGGIFISSICVLVFAVVQMIRTDLQMEQQLQEWERRNLSSHTGEQRPVERLLVEPLLVHKKEESADIKEETSASQASQLVEYAFEKGDLIGKLIIPSLNRELPILHGTDEQQLAKGVGHYIGSALPGESNHAILAGHRETVFRGLGELELGEQIQIETMAGLFTYQLETKQIVDADDRTVIVASAEPRLTLITCYPFDFVGSAPKRYILSGKQLEE